jgi:hypothetical protein
MAHDFLQVKIEGRKMRIKTIWIRVAAMLALVSPVTKVDADTSTMIPSINKTLSLYISQSETTFPPSEQVRLTISLMNTGNEPYFETHSTPLWFDYFSIKDAAGNDVPTTLLGKTLWANRPDNPVDYSHDRELSQWIPAHGGVETYTVVLNRLFDLSMAGSYTVLAYRFFDFGAIKLTKVCSNVCRFNVTGDDPFDALSGYTIVGGVPLDGDANGGVLVGQPSIRF